MYLYAMWTHSNTTINADGVTTSSTLPTGYIDTSAGPLLYVGPNATEITYVKDPSLIRNVTPKNYVDSEATSSTAASYQLITNSSESTTLTSISNILAILTGTLAHTIVFPAAVSLPVGSISLFKILHL